MKALRIIYKGGTSTFQELLHKEDFASFFIFLKNESVSIHHKNLQILAIEMFKTQWDLFAKFLRKIFVHKAS